MKDKWSCILVKLAQSCPTLCDPMDYSPPGSSVRGFLQARILEWVAISFSRRSSQPRDRTRVSRIVGVLNAFFRKYWKKMPSSFYLTLDPLWWIRNLIQEIWDKDHTSCLALPLGLPREHAHKQNSHSSKPKYIHLCHFSPILHAMWGFRILIK